MRASLELLWLAPLLALLAWVGDLVDPAHAPAASMLAVVAAGAFFVPALAEELFFRAALLPGPGLPVPLWRSVAAIALFVLWHPLQVFIFGAGWGAVVTNPAFLVAVAALGWALTRVYVLTRSIWPAVLLHWLVVLAWKAAGGPSPWS